MTALLSPRTARAASAVDGYRQGFLSAVTVAALGLLTVTVLTLVGWATAPHADAGVLDAVHAAGHLWLLAQGVPLTTAAGPFELVPLGVTVAAWALLAVGISRSPRSSRSSARQVLALIGGAGAGYALSALTVAMLLGLSGGREVRAAVAALVLSVTAVLAGLLRAEPDLFPVPERLRVAMRGAAGGVFVLIAGGAVIAAVTLLLHLPEATAATGRLQAGWAGNTLLVVAQLAYVPVLAIWAAAVAVGPGFALGAGAVSLGGTSVLQTPAVPVLAALPPVGPLPLLAVLAVLAVPLVAGLLTGVLVGREADDARAAAGTAALAGLFAGAALGLACLPASGALAGGFYATAGPSAVPVGLAAGLELGGLAAVTAYLMVRRRGPDVRGR